MTLHDFLFELGTEELPSGSVKPLAEALANNLKTLLAEHHLKHKEVHFFATPRRLAVLIHDLASLQPTQQLSKRGPAVSVSVDEHGKPLQALYGFAKSCGVDVNDLKTMKTEKGEWWVYETETIGQKTEDLLVPIIHQALKTLPITKPMRWGNEGEEFIRPVHWAVLLYGDNVIPGQFLGVSSGDLSYGHRFHHPKAVKIQSPRLYEETLKKVQVIASFNERRQLIQTQVEQIAQERQMKAIIPEALLDEVTSIVEWPQALLGTFNSAFLDVPAEALIAAMQSHQKCFAVTDKENRLAPYFIAVANIHSLDPRQVIEGNEKVIRARLSDAAFFYQQDKKRSLASLIQTTETVIFQQRLGSLADKASRMAQTMEYLSQPLDLNPAEANRAAQLSKCDLLTGMVGEFPELQGLMGYYYAAHDGEALPVAIALNEQYWPKFAADGLPTTRLGCALSLADRFDTLVGLFAIGQKPTGVKDPFKLRRHALAVVRILIQLPVQLNISTLIKVVQQTYADKIKVSADLVQELKTFILERMQSYYQSQHIPQEFVQAVRARQDDWLFDVDKRIKALVHFMQLPAAASLAAACKRVNNILLQRSKSETSNQPTEVQTHRFTEAAESMLWERIEAIEQVTAPYYLQGNYELILTELASLREPLDVFFDKVLVLVDDEAVRHNRLQLLTRLNQLLQSVADISLLGISK